MKIVWEWSLESEAKRLVEMTHKISNGFYHLHHFLPVPYSIHHGSSHNPSHLVYLPNLPYSQIPRYWEQLSKLNDQDYDNEDLLKLANLLLPELMSLAPKPLNPVDLINQSNITLPKIASWLKHAFPNLPLPSNLIIHPTHFGTLGSFSLPKDKTITLYLRTDQDLYTLVELFLSAILRPHAGNTLYSDWEKTEYLVDYLMLESSLKNLLPKNSSWSPTTTPPNYNQALIDESRSFISKLGIPNPASNHFKVKDNSVYFGNLNLSTLTSREILIMKKLIESSPIPVTNDQIADLIFSNDSKFSLTAIGKTIERLRKKLNILGISSSYIATASGIGYYLKS